ncbi:MAG: serine aminopeptidase domain-containing protein [Pseudohongiellaceae bacterium]
MSPALFHPRSLLRLFATALCACLLPASLQAQAPLQGRDLMNSTDPRVEHRSYRFENTGENLPYAVFVSSKVDRSVPAPLIVNLHGLGVGPGFMLRGKLLDLAEEQGYIVVGPIGYSVGGWYGTPVIAMNNQPVEPANLSELSEQDVLDVLAMIRDEFQVDPKRTYLLGHSMGGAGTLYLGAKHAANWAAIAAIAPAAFRLEPPATLDAVKDTLPILVVTGDADTLVSPDTVRRWRDYMAANVKTQQYTEYAGADHGSIIDLAMDEIFTWFAAHPKP